jgi:hypothetical protein
MNIITRLIGLNILVFMLWGAAALGGKLGIYIDIPSIIMVAGVLIGGVLLCFPIQQIIDAFQAAIEAERAAPVSNWQREQRIAVFARLYQLAWGGGLVGSLIGIIAMLSDLSDPASIGAGMAVALLTAAYGALLAEFIFNPMQQMVMNQCPTGDDPDVGGQSKDRPSPVPTPGQTALFKGVALIAIIVTMFMVPIVSFSEIKQNDALDPATEAIYLRYLLGDDAPRSNAVSPRLEATFEQRQRETAAVYARLHELMPDKSESEIDEIALIILAIPQTKGIDPEASHLWRQHLVDVYYYKAVGAY